ncbi:MAG: hypothetical protein IJM38_03805 [Ruminococcus sp.]|nr:hypothetical protein [Ruminococcus sp.]
MKKELLDKGLENIDDELINEAATVSVISYKAKIRLIRTAVIGAAAATVITAAMLIHFYNEKNNNNGGDDNLIVPPETTTQMNEAAIVSTSITYENRKNDKVVETTASSKNITTTKASTAPAVLTETTSSVIVTTTETDETEQTVTDQTYPDETVLPFEYYYSLEDGLFQVLKDYSYAGDPDIACVKYGNAFLKERFSFWINCDKEQSDRNLDMVNRFELSDEYEEIGFEGGGFILRVYYKDGTFMEYELYDQFGILDITDRNGNRQRFKDKSGNSRELLLALQSDQMQIDAAISSILYDAYGYKY